MKENLGLLSPQTFLLHYQVTWMMIRLEKREVTIVILKISALVNVAIPVVTCGGSVCGIVPEYTKRSEATCFSIYIYTSES